MSWEQFAMVMTAFAAVLGGVAGLLVQVRETHKLVNSRMTQMLVLVEKAAGAAGEKRGREFTPPAPLPSIDPGQDSLR